MHIVDQLFAYIDGMAPKPEERIALIAAATIIAHITVRLVRWFSEWLISRTHAAKRGFGAVVQRPKVITVHRLIVSGLIFCIYFLAGGLILHVLGVNLTAYVASASVIGLAVSFGSQGLVQDIVSGLTLIMLDTMDVGDMVEIAGTVTVVGVVEEIGLRFTKLTNFYNQRVLIPNRTIANVSRFPHGGVDAYADVWIPHGVDAGQVVPILRGMANGLWTQFDEIVLGEPVTGEAIAVTGGTWSFCRIHFKIWPGQGGLIETTFRQEVVKAMKGFDPAYSDWQVPVTYRAGSGASAGKRIRLHADPTPVPPPSVPMAKS